MNKQNDYQKAARAELNTLITDHLPLVSRIAGYLKARVPKFIEYDDMVQIGTLGLMSAAESYKTDLGVEFKDFAKTRIKGAILDEVRRMSSMSRLAIKNSQAHNQATHKLANDLGMQPTSKQVAEHLGLSVTEYEDQRTHADRFRMEDLDFEDGSFEDRQIGAEPNPLEQIEDEQLKKLVAQKISRLDDRKRLVMSLYYVDEMNMKEIGAIIGVKEARVSQILSGIAKDLRAELALEI
ncbi:MAG: FliA/WhiG family RNA polymerase sigma factor [Gammaproteobacteria bacterium]|nr:FliA/WhiG family RNA polymerase sigma factor [Gammaproteobacteria bacterium]